MEFLFSSPFPIAGIFLALVILGVFIFELKSRKDHGAQTPPLPPTSIRLPKPESAGPGKKTLFAIGGMLVLLALVIPVTVVLVNQKQTSQKQASDSAAPTVTPFASDSTPSKISTTPGTQQLTSTSSVSCLAFTADPSSGRVPLTVSFQARVQDETNTIEAFEFDFGDGTKQPIEKSYAKGVAAVQSVDHVYTEEGNYSATVRARNDKDTWSDISDTCTITIIASLGSDVGIASDGSGGSATPSPTRTPTPKPPVTATISATLIPTKTPAPTLKVASGSATKPSIPEAGTSLPTIAIIAASILFLTVAVVLAL